MHRIRRFFERLGKDGAEIRTFYAANAVGYVLHIELSAASQYMNEAEALLSGREYEVSSAPVLELAPQSGCRACGGEFVHLAQDRAVRVVTSDKKVLRTFPHLTVSPQERAAYRGIRRIRRMN